MKFKAVIRKGEDFGYVAEVPSLPGCVSQGDSVRKAIANIKEAIGLYIEDMKPEEIKKAADSKTELYEIAV
ncbi:MAG TPA: type II toxin-antitoxin system HicB family antitoxin [bacterium]|nr:type II toxin-antitoxin system HicB family antitoxin [bacterium]